MRIELIMSILLRSSCYLAFTRSVTRFHRSSSVLSDNERHAPNEKEPRRFLISQKMLKVIEIEKLKCTTVEKEKIKGSYSSERSGIKMSHLNHINSDENRNHKSQVLKYFVMVSAKSDGLRRAASFLYMFPTNEVNMDAYECLFKYLARKGDLPIIQKFWAKFVKSKVKPSLPCYASVFQCLVNFTDSDKSLADELFEELVSNHGTDSPHQLFSGAFLRSQSDYDQALTGIRMAKANFEPSLQDTSSSEAAELYAQNDLLRPLSQVNVKRLQSAIDNVSLQECNLLLDEQIRCEKEGFVKVKSVAVNHSQSTEDIDVLNRCVDSLKKSWKDQLLGVIERRIKINRKYGNFKPHPQMVPIFPFLESLQLDMVTDVLLDEIESMISFSDAYSPNVRVFQKQLGSKIMERIQLCELVDDPAKMDKYTQVITEYLRWFLSPSSGELNAWCPREAFEAVNKKVRGKALTHDHDILNWPSTIRQIVGRELFMPLCNKLSLQIGPDGSVIIDDIACNQNSNGDLIIKPRNDKMTDLRSSPALYRVLRNRSNKVYEEIKPHPILSKIFERQKLSSMKFSSTHVPMLVPPLPWSSSRLGGFYLRTSDFCRFNAMDIGSLELEKIEKKWDKAYPVFDALNQLGSTPWRVNENILDVALEVFQNQKAHSDLLDSLSIAAHPDLLVKPTKMNEMGSTKISGQEYKEHAREMNEYNKAKLETYSLWCDALYKLSIANHYRNSVMYFPHNIDFRGRVYPIAPYFHHMGGDLSRSMLRFAKGKKLGKRGFDWLKIHCINLTELKKKSPVQDRLAYADEVMDDILDSANNPLTGKKWWVKTEDPWQTLSTCFEIRDALNHPEGPENFVSHLPIHQDGSCNGLQHYAALGRDVLGATYVNVVPSGAPKDIYSEIAALVEEKRAADHKKDPASIAAELEGYVVRKVIKQTVMTTVYGVTKYGAQLQIAKQLNDMPGLRPELVSPGSKYLAAKTFESLNDMFTSSQAIQSWFTQCAEEISDGFRKNVEWITPLGLYVVQPYSRAYKGSKPPEEKAFKQGHGIPLKNPLNSRMIKPNTIKQKNGFPPNFVHSLDSTHMMLTSLYLWSIGCTFASVHDCFWTHAQDVDLMNKTCREQFVNLHKQPILESLASHFNRVYITNEAMTTETQSARAQVLFARIPKKGKLDLDVVKESTYFFS